MSYTSLLPLYMEDLAKARSRTAVQAVLIPRSAYSFEAARRWVLSHGFSVTKPPDVTRAYYRYRQEDPADFYQLRTRGIAGGVKLIIGWRR